MIMPENTSSPVLAEGEHFAEVNGVTLHYTVRGSGPVALVPAAGWGPSVDYLIPLPVLERHCTVVYFDTRHSGLSTGPESADQYTLDHYVADIEALRAHLETAKIFIVGHSGGGHQALAYGIEHSDKLLGIISISAIVSADSVRQEQMMQLLAKRKDEPFYQAHPGYYEEGLAAMAGENGSLTIEQVLDKTGAFYFHNPELAPQLLPKLKFDNQVLAYSAMSGFQSKNLLPELSRIAAPTLIVVGDDDYRCDAQTQGVRAHEQMPSSTLEIIKDCGHFVWVDQPEAFDAACEAWFKHLTSVDIER